MQLSASQLTLPGALPGPQDPQPFFRVPVQDLEVSQNGTFRPEDLEGYGVGCGALTVLFRYFGLYPEGVTYAILLMNACAWALDKALPPVRFGAVRGGKAG